LLLEEDERELLTEELEMLEPVELTDEELTDDDELVRELELEDVFGSPTAARRHARNASLASSVVPPTFTTVLWYVARH